MVRLMTLTALGAVALTAVLASPSAAGEKAKTDLEFSFISQVGGEWSYSGFIDSKKKCADKRRVIVYRFANGPDVEIGRTRANAAVGAWSVEHPDLPDGTYYAKAPSTRECKGDVSDDLGVDN